MKVKLGLAGDVLCVFLNNLFAFGCPKEVKFEMNHSSRVLSDFAEVVCYPSYCSSEIGDN